MGHHGIHELDERFTPAMAQLTVLNRDTPDYVSSCLLRVVQNSAYVSSLSMCDIIKLVWQAGYLVHIFIGWRSEVWNWIWLWRSETVRAMGRSGVQGAGVNLRLTHWFGQIMFYKNGLRGTLVRQWTTAKQNHPLLDLISRQPRNCWTLQSERSSVGWLCDIELFVLSNIWDLKSCHSKGLVSTVLLSLKGNQSNAVLV